MRKIKKVAYITDLMPISTSVSQYNKNFVRYTGNNTGNYLFHNAIINFFEPDIFTPIQLTDELIDQYDVFISCELIWIREDTDLHNNAFKTLDLIHSRSKILLPLCVGLQARGYLSKFRFSPRTLKALQELSERIELPCRGYYTAEMLNKVGIKNTIPVGCPSLYSGMNPNFQLQKPSRLGASPKISLNFTPFINGRSSWSSFAYMLFLAIHYNALCVGQAQNEIYQLTNIFHEDKDLRSFLYDTIIKNYHYYYSIPEWQAAISECDFSLGNRFHSNVMSVISGTPALFLLSDSRVQEMCEFFSLPAVDMNIMERNPSIEELYEMTDYTSFNRKYRERYENYEHFLLCNELIEKLEFNDTCIRDEGEIVLQKYVKITIFVDGRPEYVEAVVDSIVKTGYRQRVQLLVSRNEQLTDQYRDFIKTVNSPMNDLSDFLEELCTSAKGRYIYFLREPIEFSPNDISDLSKAILCYECDVLIRDRNSLSEDFVKVNRMFGHECKSQIISHLFNDLFFTQLPGKLFSRALLKKVWVHLEGHKKKLKDVDAEFILPLLLFFNANRVIVKDFMAEAEMTNTYQKNEKKIRRFIRSFAYLRKELHGYMKKATVKKYLVMYIRYILKVSGVNYSMFKKI